MTDIRRQLGRLLRTIAAAATMFVAIEQPAALAQSIVVMVNDEPVTSYDIAQRQRFLALSANLNERMKSRMQSDKTKQEFQRYMQKNQPKSREEAQALQKKFVKNIQQNVIASAGRSMRQKAIDELIEEKLMLQAAAEQKITVSDDEVDEFLTRMAQSGSRKNSLKQFLANFRAQGVDPSTLKHRIRAQSAWRQVIRRVYGSRIRASSPTDIPVLNAGGGTILDVEILRIKVDGDQKAVAEKLVEAEKIRKDFKSCAQLGEQAENISGATVQSVKQANLKDFRGDAQAVLQKAKNGEMAPPIVTGSTIELHAVCTKKTIKPAQSASASSGTDDTQQQFQLYSERHLKDMRSRAHLKYPKNG